MKPPIFIVGPHRAGSTLWHNLVAMAPGVMRIAEPRFLGPPRQRDFAFFLRSQARDLSSAEDIETLVDLMFSRKGLPGLEAAFWRFESVPAASDSAMKLAIVRAISESDRQIGSIARILITELTRFSGFERAAIKFPVDVSHLPELMSWFPEGRFVHITRDPRAVAMSKSNDPSGTALRVVRYPALAWLIRKGAALSVVREYRIASRVHKELMSNPHYRLFRYEDLLLAPEQTLRDLCAHIEVEFSPAMLSPETGAHKHQPSSITGKRQDSFDRHAATRWKTVISWFDYALISTLTWRSMRTLRG